MKKTRFALFAALAVAVMMAFTSCGGVSADKQGMYVPAKVIRTEGSTTTTDVVNWNDKTCTHNGEACKFMDTYNYWEDAYKVEATKAKLATNAVNNDAFAESGYQAYVTFGDSEYEVKAEGDNILLQTDAGILGKITWVTFIKSDDDNYAFYTEYTPEDKSYTRKTYYSIY